MGCARKETLCISQDSPGTARVTMMSWDTLPWGVLGKRHYVYPRIATGLSELPRHTEYIWDRTWHHWTWFVEGMSGFVKFQEKGGGAKKGRANVWKLISHII